MVCFQDSLGFFLTLFVFGGIKESGIGREGSQHGIDDFLEMKYLAWAGVRDV